MNSPQSQQSTGQSGNASYVANFIAPIYPMIFFVNDVGERMVIVVEYVHTLASHFVDLELIAFITYENVYVMN